MPSRQPALFLTSTIKGIDYTFRTWCYHHLTLFDRIVLWIDEPSELSSAQIPTDPRITVLLGSQIASGSLHGRFMIRQDLNCNTAISMGRSNSVPTWLCHLDSDELLYVESRDAFRSLFATERGQIRFRNHEVCPHFQASNPFLECSLFKLNGRYPFNFYSNGKSCVRCDPHTSANGAHVFSGYEGSSYSCENEAVVLHYACATFSLWWKKYAALGDFPDFWCDDQRYPIGLPFHLASRDIVGRCITDNDLALGEEFFLSSLLSKAAVRHGADLGTLKHFHPVQGRRID